MVKPKLPQRLIPAGIRKGVLAIVNAGVITSEPEQNKRTRVINISSLIAASLVFFFGGGLTIMSGNTLILYPAVPETILFASAILLNQRKQYFWSSVIWHFTFCSATFIFGVMLSSVIDATHMAGYLIGAPLLIFNRKETKLLTVCIACSIAALVGIEVITQLDIVAPLEISGSLYPVFRVATWLTVILLNVVVILFYLQQNNILIARLSKANNKLSNVNVKLSKESFYKTVYVNETTHELRSPLNALYAINKVLQDPDLSETDRQKMHESIDYSLNHALEIINNVLALAKIESGQTIPVNIQSLQLREWLHNTVQVFMYQASVRELTITAAVHPGTPEMVNFPRIQVTQVLNNLVSNALKFSKKGGAIRIEAAMEENFLCLTVQDSGKGMSEETLARLFTPFFSSGDNNPTGTGLGMHIAKKITEQLGGSLTAETKMGLGSKFTARFRTDVAVSSETNNTPNLPALYPAKVLIIDDDVVGSHYYGKMLNNMGCEVEVAHTGAEGLQMAEKRRPDIIFLDMKLPDIDGKDLLQVLKSHHTLSSVPVVFVTGSNLPEERAAAWDLGADEYVVKPMQLSTLTRILQEHTSH
ncbi:ATP-binding protein [Chitinophaga sp. GCM10012297]|uniref:histidine kinase n=1 Tax=Chitinophaga chungangae TaxID=2821488 RepID=A0ABS3YAV5_9BACT|nr:ATP-binding protein [Chitinophaga chungangae]MBO9151781.1 response regulator [Chitinophaga chungangae]